MTRKPKGQGKIDRAALAETEREPVTKGDVESAMRQVMEHPAKPEQKSETGSRRRPNLVSGGS